MTRSWLWWAATATVVALVIAAFPPTKARFDFSAFYCAGKVLAEGKDPYRYEPLRTCEASHFQLPRNAAIPVPLPPAAIAIFEPIARLNFPVANALWVLLIAAGAALFTFSTVGLTRLPPWLVALCAVSGLWATPYQIGAMAPIPIALLTAAALFLVRKRWWASACFIGAACIQPHIGIPVLLSAFVLVRQMRIPCALVSLTVAILSAYAGPTLDVEYLTMVLPAHASSELGNADQYALTSVLHFVGLPDAVAIFIGTVQYLLFLVAGLLMAAFLRKRMPEAVVLVPLTCAVAGGTFIHQPEVAGALGLALVLAARSNRAVAWAAVILLAIPWQVELDFGFGVLPGLIVAGVLWLRSNTRGPKAIAIGCLVTLAFVMVRRTYHHAFPSGRIRAVDDGALAESAWRQVSALNVPTWSWLPSHVLTYSGIAIVLILAVREAFALPLKEAPH